MEFITIIYADMYKALAGIPKDLNPAGNWAVYCINRISDTVYVTYVRGRA